MVTALRLTETRGSDEEIARRVGHHLLTTGLLDELALQRAERAQRTTGERFDLVLTRLGLVPEASLIRALADVLELEVATPEAFPTSRIAIDQLDGEYLRTNRILPIALDADRLIVAVDTPFEDSRIAALSFLIERPVERWLATARDLEDALERLYGTNARAENIGLAAPSQSEDSGADDVIRLKDAASEAPVIKLVQDLIVRAVASRASDIHIESRLGSLCVRYRIDGVLHTVERLPLLLAPAVMTRVKVIARLDIAERRLPQDGRIKSTVQGREIDLRVSTVPTISGESLVLRILDRSAVQLDLTKLGFSEELRARLQQALEQPNGIILVTGPTGSGKTTTLYAGLGTLDRETRKIITVEDPIEYQLADINQIQVNPGIGLTFSSTLRSILRQDPDVIMLGEIRDLETAQISIQAALTGHLVLSTVHTNSAVATLTRLIDMGVENFLLSSSIVGILAQRLVRRLCRQCATEDESLSTVLESLRKMAEWNGPGGVALRAVGCPACLGTGYHGRTAIGEFLVLTTAVKKVLNCGASEQDLETTAIEEGMRSMYQDGLRRVLAGATTMEEVLRVTRTAE